MTNEELSRNGRNDHEALPFNLTDLDREVLSQTDEEFVYHDWEEMKQIVGRNLHTIHTSPAFRSLLPPIVYLESIYTFLTTWM